MHGTTTRTKMAFEEASRSGFITLNLFSLLLLHLSMQFCSFILGQKFGFLDKRVCEFSYLCQSIRNRLPYNSALRETTVQEHDIVWFDILDMSWGYSE